MSFKRWFILFICFVCLKGAQGYAGESRWEEPWPKEARETGMGRDVRSSELSIGQRAAQETIRFFQKYISPVDGDRCPCYPTCSQYSVEAIRKHGFWMGMVMTFDRLIHESDEIRQAPMIKIYGSYRYYDPVENNDFWWGKNSDQPSAVSNQRKNSVQH